MTDSHEDLWRTSTRGAGVELDHDPLLASLQSRGRRTDRALRCAEMLDLWGGILFVVILAFLFGRYPDLLAGAPIYGIAGAVILALAYATYHVQGYLARARDDAGDPTMVEFLRAEQRHVERRIRLLSGVWLHVVVAAIGAWLMIHAAFDGIATRLAFDLGVAVIALGFWWLAARTCRRVYEPLRASIDRQLTALQN